MTSTMENNAHFKDVSDDIEPGSQLLIGQQDRQSRLPSLKNGSTMRSSMTSGSTFGVGTSVWNNGANIWRSANRFTDGAAEEDTARSVYTGTSSAEVLTNSNDSKSHSGQSALFALGKAGSMSLLSSSESEAPLRRSNVPWSTSVNTNLGFGSRPQAQPISPLRQLGDESSSSGQRFRKGVAHTPTTIPSTGVDFEQTHQNLSHPGSISQQTLDMSGLGEYLPSFEENQTLLNSNAAAFHSNGVTATNPVSRRFPHSDDGFRNGISYNEMAHIAPDNGYAIFRADREAASSGNHLLSERPPANGFCPSFQNTHNFPQRENHQETFLPFNHDLTSSSFTHKNRGRMGAYPRDEETGFQSHPQSQENWPGSRVAYQRHIARSGFEDVPDESSSSLKSARTPESAQESKHQYFPFHNRTISSGNLGTASPTASEYRHGLQSPPYSTTDTPPRDSESMRSSSNSGISSRTSNGYPSSFERKLRDSGPYQRDHSLLQFRTLQPNVCFSPAYSFSTYTSAMRMNPLANPYTMPGYASLPPASRYFSRESDQSQIVRSPLLEEFRMNNKNNKRYELRDIYNHVVEFSGDQHGSRFIQQRLETANSDEKNQIFTEIQPNSLQLMTDVFGNYVIQKLFEHGNQSQKKVLANQMKGHVLSLSMQMYGCRVVQKALEHVLTDQQASIVKELETHVLKCVKDQNGNHVIQKAIERIPAQHIQFIIYAFTDQVQRLATHPYGCRVIQRMLEHCEESAKRSILAELHACVPSLITDQFGNYVIQHVIENGEAADRRRIVAVVESQLLVYSKHKFASNVVEKSIEFAEEGQRTEILRRLTAQDEKGESPVFGLMRDQYGNYVIQKILAQLKGAEREALINQIKAHLAQLKRFSYGKQIIAIEKLIFDDGNLSTSSQSSAFPSTNASTVEGPITTPYLQDASKPHEPRVTLPHSNPYTQP